MASIFLTLPAVATVDAGNECSHGLISRSRLELIVTAAFRLAAAAGEVIGIGLQLGSIAVLFSDLLSIKEDLPFIRRHVLVCHECNKVSLDLLTLQLRKKGLITFQIHHHAAQSIDVYVCEVDIVPFLHDISKVRLLNTVVENTLLEVLGDLIVFNKLIQCGTYVSAKLFRVSDSSHVVIIEDKRLCLFNFINYVEGEKILVELNDRTEHRRHHSIRR